MHNTRVSKVSKLTTDGRFYMTCPQPWTLSDRMRMREKYDKRYCEHDVMYKQGRKITVVRVHGIIRKILWKNYWSQFQWRSPHDVHFSLRTSFAAFPVHQHAEKNWSVGLSHSWTLRNWTRKDEARRRCPPRRLRRRVHRAHHDLLSRKEEGRFRPRPQGQFFKVLIL